ncbi:hypothetical protein BJX76DRAFT_354023 [Aspergillus varians]
MSNDIQGEIGFLARDPVYETVKPYNLRFAPPDDLPRNNLQREKRRVTIKDARDMDVSIDVNGFCLVRLSTSMTYSDFNHPSQIEGTYARKLAANLEPIFNTRHVRVMDYLVRRRHRDYPNSNGKDFVNPQPAGLAHLDFSLDEAVRMLRTMYGDRVAEILQPRWQVINVWRPLKGPLADWPLAVCDTQTFDAARDSLASDAVYPEWTYENVMVHYNPRQAWYYFHALEVGETMLFKYADSDASASGDMSAECFLSFVVSFVLKRSTNCSACPHVAFPNPRASPEEPPRESIESRVFVLYAPFENFPEETGAIYGNRI